MLETKDLLSDDIELNETNKRDPNEIPIKQGPISNNQRSSHREKANHIADEFELNLNSLHAEYDYYISQLHRKYQLAKEERKRSEMEAKVLKHRVGLLHSQEKTAVQKFERTRNRLGQIIENRKFFYEEENNKKELRKMKENNLNKLKENVKNIKEKRNSVGRCQTAKNPRSSVDNIRDIRDIRVSFII